MVTHPSEYNWSSYGCNSLGQTDNLVIPHPEYQRLGQNDGERRTVYQQLSAHQISEECINAVREATNKACVLGNDRFKRNIQEKLKRRAQHDTKTPYPSLPLLGLVELCNSERSVGVDCMSYAQRF
jgi:putative transposase